MTTLTANVLDAYPWVAERFEVLRTEQGGAFAVAGCPVGNYEDARVRLWVFGEALCLKCMHGCSNLEILRSVGMTWADCFPGRVMPDRPRQDATFYPYCDEAGKLLYETVRLEPGRGGRDKDFRQRQPDGKGGWLYHLTGVRRVLYRLPELIAADPRRTVIVCAGEKDCESLKRLGMLATTNVCGERAEWLADYSLTLAGRHVVVIADADGPGRRHCDEVVGSLVRHKAASVTPVELPEKDATAFLNALHRRGVHNLSELSRKFTDAWKGVPRWVPV